MGIGRYVGRTGFRSARAGGPKFGPPYVRSLAVAFTVLLVSIALNGQAPPPTTVKDRVYAKEQAARGEKLFGQTCAKCHLFDGPVTKDGPPLGGDVFLTKWDGKSVFEMAVGIRLNMPPDGSVILEENETADLVAFILKANGFPAGDQPLNTGISSKSLIFVKNKVAPPMPLTPIADHAIATLTVPGSADFLVADGDAVWITNRGRMEMLQRDQSAPVKSVAVPRPCGAPALGFGAVWVANCMDRSLYRIDRATATVAATMPTGLADRSGELSIGAGAGSIWLLTDAAGVLSRIDPRTNTVVAQIAVAPNSFAAVFGFDAVWITNTGARGAAGPGSLQRIDPATNRVVATIPVGPTPRFLAAGEGAVWTLNQGDGTVSRIDPATNKVVATIDAGVPGGGGDIAAGAGRVWVRASKVLLQAIDPATNRVVEAFGPGSGSGAVRVAGEFVWVSAHDIQTVWVLGSPLPRRVHGEVSRAGELHGGRFEGRDEGRRHRPEKGH